MVSQGNRITAADINSIIDKIESESSYRVVSETLSDVVAGSLIEGQTFKDMISQNTTINNKHCFCEAGGSGIESHSGGSSISLSATDSNFDAGDLIYASHINEIETDIDNLIAQCGCDSHACSCVSNCTSHCACDGECTCVGDSTSTCSQCACENQCTCHDDCGCQDQCSCNGECACDGFTCSCEFVGGCPCDTDSCPCEGVCDNVSCNTHCSCYANCNCHSECSCHTIPCGTECNIDCGTHNTCYSHCTCDGQCGCNGECSCVSDCSQCGCENECTCNQVCSCEFGG